VAIASMHNFLALLPELSRAPQRRIQLSYDAEADVLYISLGAPVEATDTEPTDDDVLIRYRGDEIIGYTILHASTPRP
jgi:uncharacterized protein YuzE